MNPAVSAILATTFLVLWRKRPDQAYLLMLAFGFLACGLAFVVNDLLPNFESFASRIAANALFLAAIVLACIGALLRVKAPVPVALFGAASLVGAALFVWFLVVSPSTEARIYVVSAIYVVLTGTTAWTLSRATPLNGMDRMFIILALALTALSVLRPLATLLNQLDTDGGDGSLQHSAYWATVQAATPVLAITIGLAFLGALALRLFDELSTEANRDFLTGLFNRRGFERGVQKSMSGLDATARPGVMVVDIDNFKLVNDNFGHGAGDTVIAAVADVLAAYGDAELTARTGGEEFTLFYAEATRSGLEEHAADIREAMAGMSIPGMAADHAITLSIGLYLGSASDAISDMLTAADRALYEAKRGGKDRAVFGAAPLRAVPTDPERRARG
jgi:diguanylate cyclase (GGDEF)-like protein